MTSNKTAWGYVRLSQDSDTSIEKQKASIRKYAREHGLELQTTRNDGNQTSGFNADRQGYQILREKIEAGAIDAVITRDRARLSRDFDERLRLIAVMRETGVEWHVTEANGPLGLGDVQTAGVEAIHAAMDDAKKRMEIERAKAATQERINSGYDHGRSRFGMQYDSEGKYQVPGAEWPTVERIWALAEDGETQVAIAKEVGVARSTVRSVIENREWYEKRAKQAD